MEYLLHIAILAIIFTILAWSLDVVAGHAGLLSVVQAGFCGIGAYASALCAVKLGLGFLSGAGIGMLAAVAASTVMSLTALRLGGDHFVIATFGFQMILFSVFNNWMEVTRGPLGIPGIPHPVIFGWHVDSHGQFLLLALLAAGCAYAIMRRLITSPFGRVLRAIREDEIFAKAQGKNPLYFKVAAFAMSAALASTAGSLFAHYITYIDPVSFTVVDSILIISMVVIGGAGNLWGPVAGAVILVVLPEALRFIGVSSGAAANLRQIVYGSLLVVMMMFRSRGLLGHYGFGR